MANFKKKTKTSQDIPTAALPDIIFMLLFFFMVSTTMKDSEVKVSSETPEVSELRKLEKKKPPKIYAGFPKDASLSKKGKKATLIQANDAIIQSHQVKDFILQARSKVEDKKGMVTAIFGDKNIEAGVIEDIEVKLREANALKVNYAGSLESVD